jgi:cbb3-type cytochrome oxidase subunit 3
MKEEKNMNGGVNVGDIIFQLFALGIPIFFIAILFLFWRSSKKKKAQLNRIEEKLDTLQKKN